MASSSSSTSSSSFASRKSYDVFLSFRGEDTRNTFIGHLYDALTRHGIYTFIDDVGLAKGKSIGPDLLKNIEESRYSVVVFSKNYADSSWCLDELVHIMKCKDAFQGYSVIPVFFDVEPTEVRKQTGEFGNGFARHNKSGNLEGWRKALREASSLSGCHLKNYNGHEARCINDIVKTISEELNKYAFADRNLVGIERRIENVKSLLGVNLGGFRMIGIWGMGGAGKTTLARALFDKFSNKFDSGSFIENVRTSVLKSLQEKLLSDVLREKDVRVDSVHQGKQIIPRRLSGKKVLVVLDDVDSVSQLSGLAGSPEWFGQGSRIIITTREEQVLVSHGVKKEEIHNVALLNDEEATHLFSRCAFGTDTPPEDFMRQSGRVIHYAAGLPLSIEVLGSFLRGRDKAFWEGALKDLQKIPKDGILELLKVSYNGLTKEYKDVFLHIACFFRGWMKDKLVRILGSCQIDSGIILTVLQQKSLITMDERVEMHDLIQEMGESIVRLEHPKEPGKHSRLWRPDEILDVLTENSGTEVIEAIAARSASEYLDLSNISSEAFINMKRLEILYLDHNQDHFQGPSSLPNKLRWLTWAGFPLESLPESFRANNLVGLDLHKSKIIQLWKVEKDLEKLKFLDLSHSKKLIRTPDFSAMPHLMSLKLNHCSNLVEVSSSTGVHKELVCLELMRCEKLEIFPETIEMEKLEKLNMLGCTRLKKIPEFKGEMNRLSELSLAKDIMEGLPSTLGNLTNLIHLDLGHCRKLKNLPDSICQLKHLETLDLRFCSSLEGLPENLGYIESLERININSSSLDIRRLPASVRRKTIQKPSRHYKIGEFEVYVEDA